MQNNKLRMLSTVVLACCVVAVLSHEEDVLVDVLVVVPVRARLLHSGHARHSLLQNNRIGKKMKK
jgi:hypothetical protein